MKKLSLKNLKLDVDDLLQREQLKTIFGGSGGNCPDDECQTDSDCPEVYPNCTNFNFTESCKNEPTTMRAQCI